MVTRVEVKDGEETDDEVGGGGVGPVPKRAAWAETAIPTLMRSVCSSTAVRGAHSLAARAIFSW